MFKQEQVLLTYTTQRWLLLLPGFILLATSAAYATVFAGGKGAEHLQMTFGLGFPIMMGFIWLVSTARWQFANPRARLLPGFTGPHLGVLATVFVLILLANPLCLAMGAGLSTPGTLAYALLLGGATLWGMQPGRGIFMLPTMVIFFSGMTSAGINFWFAVPNQFTALHGAMAVTGGAMVLGWLWRLSMLHEEMDDYQIVPLGTPGGHSRMERAEQRKLLGRVSARHNIIQALADRWHDRLHHLTERPQTRSQLLQYGFGRLSGETQALIAGLAFAAYGIFLSQLSFVNGGRMGPASGFVVMAIQFAMMGPAVITGLRMMLRLPRMAQELLRPATREEYLDGLLLAMAKQTGWLWLALQIGLLAMILSTGAFPDENLWGSAMPYLLISLTAQVPTLGLSLWLARKGSMWRIILGLYAAMIFHGAVLGAWWWGRKQIGDLLFVTVATIVLLTLGAMLITWARRAWLREELG
ncbi:MAG: hypothetical protein GXP26_03210 [Planctomycetes bacterium]|nr:hypothetical protein [Planctomycetota bacterium]